jgi:tetratricopeptide (TPR) repeat protein
MIYGALWGYAYGRVVTRAAAARTAPDFAPVYAAVGWTAVLHGIYNTLVEYGHAGLGMLIDMIAALAVLGLLRELSINSPYYAYPLSQYRTAIPAIRRGLRLEPNNAVLYRRLGLYLLYARRYETAVKAFDEYLKRRPGSVYVQVYRAVAMFLRGYTDIARESIRKLVGGLTRSDRSRIRRHVAKLVRDKEARAELLPVLDPGRGTATHRPRRVPNGTRVLVDRRLTERKEDGARPRRALAASSRKS